MDLGADFIATGHYAQVKELRQMKNFFHLLAGRDKKKDQFIFVSIKSVSVSKQYFQLVNVKK